MPSSDIFNRNNLPGIGRPEMSPRMMERGGGFADLRDLVSGAGIQLDRDQLQRLGSGLVREAGDLRGQLDAAIRQGGDTGQLMGRIIAIESAVAEIQAVLGSGGLMDLVREVAMLKRTVATLGTAGYGRSYAPGEPRSQSDTWTVGDTLSTVAFGTVSFPNGFELELTFLNELNAGRLESIASITVAGKNWPRFDGLGVSSFFSGSGGRRVVSVLEPVVGDLTINFNVTAPSAGTCEQTTTLWALSDNGGDGDGRRGVNP